MSTPEFPPLNDRSRSLSGSSDFPSQTSKQKKQGARSLLDLASRSPLSFSSSSGNSHLSTTGTNGRVPRSSTYSLFDQTSSTSKKLDTLFEQRHQNSKSTDHVNQEESKFTRTKSISEGRDVSMVRGNPPSTLTSLKNNNPGLHGTRSQNSKNAGMKRIMSEPKLINDRKNFKNSHLNNNNPTKTDSPSPKNRNKKQTSVDRNGNSRMGARANARRHVSVSTELSDNGKFHMDDADDEEDEEEERNERVLLWLQEVGRDADAPPEPNIEYDDTPPQTDSAIHIVYGES